MNQSNSTSQPNNNVHSHNSENDHHAEFVVTFHEIDKQTFAHQSDLYWAWRSLFESDQSARIIEHPDYVLLELAQLLEQNSSIPPASILFCRKNGKNIAAVILIPKLINTKRAGAFLFSSLLKGYRLAGDRLLGDQSEKCAQLLIAEAHRILRQHKSSFLLFEDLDNESTLRKVVHQLQSVGCQHFSPTGLQERLRLELPPTMDEYWSTFSKKRRYNLKRERKILDKEGTVTIKKINQVDQVADFLEDAHRVSLKTWQTRQLGLRVSKNDDDLETFTFLASQGALRSYLLYLNDEPIAFMIGNQYNGVYHYEEVGFDSDYAKYSPGKALLIAGLEDIYSDNKPTWFDFGLGDADYKRQMANHQSQSGTLWVIPSGFKNRMIITWLKMCRSTKLIAKKALQSTGLFRRLRQKLRRSKGGK